MAELAVEVKKRLEAGETLHSIRVSLIGKGHAEKEVDETLKKISMQQKSSEQNAESKNARIVTLKEVFDRLGFGFGSQQYINILFFLTGGSIFLIGIINGIKGLIIMLLSPFLQEFLKVGRIKKSAIIWQGIFFALSFVIMGIAIMLSSVPLFIAGLLLGSVFVVFYGDIYYNLVMSRLKKEHMGHFLKRISNYGLLITGAALLGGGFMMDKLPEKGYIFLMGTASLLFIISAVILFFVRVEPSVAFGGRKLLLQISIYLSNIKEHVKSSLNDKVMLILLITGAATSLVHVLGNSFYGIFIYNHLNSQGFGSFLNVAVIFLIALLSSIIGSVITQKNSREYGKFPMLVFGTLLMAIMPLTYYYNPNLVSIGMATILGVIGGSIAGVARGLLSLDLLHEENRKRYFSVSSILFIVPYVLIIPLGAYIAQNHGLQKLFLILGLTLIIFVVPLYLLIIVINHKMRKKI